MQGKLEGSPIDHDNFDLVALYVVRMIDYVVHIVGFGNRSNTCLPMVSLGFKPRFCKVAIHVLGRAHHYIKQCGVPLNFCGRFA